MSTHVPGFQSFSSLFVFASFCTAQIGQQQHKGSGIIEGVSLVLHSISTSVALVGSHDSHQETNTT